MYYLTTKEVLRIHYVVVKQFGGRQGIRELSLVESAVARPQAAYGVVEAYPDLFTKASALFYSLIKNHGFIDGNKRTAVIACAIFLKRNNYEFIVSQNELVEFTITIASGDLAESKICEWLKKHSQKLR